MFTCFSIGVIKMVIIALDAAAGTAAASTVCKRNILARNKRSIIINDANNLYDQESCYH